MKNLIYLLFICLSFKALGQSNQLTETQFYQIKFNGKSFQELSNTEGDVNNIWTLLGQPTSTQQGSGGVGEDWVKYFFNHGLTISFTDINSPNYNPSIDYIKATTININGVDISLGDNISVLGPNIIFNQKIDGTHSIVYTIGNGDCCPIILEYNQDTNLITKIEYFVWT